MNRNLIKGIDIWNPELFSKKIAIKLNGYICDIGIVLGYSNYAKYDNRRALHIKGYSGYCNEYIIDLDNIKLCLEIQVIEEEDFNKYKRLFDNAINDEQKRNVCMNIQTIIDKKHEN